MTMETAMISLTRRANASIDHAIATLENARQDIMEAEDVESVQAAVDGLTTVLSATLQTLPRQNRAPVLSDLSNMAENEENGILYGKDQSNLKRRRVTFDASADPQPQPKRSNADSQERRKFHSLQRKVRNALATMKKPIQPNQRGSKRHKQVRREAERVLADAARTQCYFDKSGECRDGSSCPFVHQRPNALDGNLHGEIYKWVSNGGKEYGFIRIDGSSQQLYCSDAELQGIPKPITPPLAVLVSNTRKGVTGKLPEALGVHVA
jgi:hypothetical protein